MSEVIDVINLFRFPGGSSITTLEVPDHIRLHEVARTPGPERDRQLAEIGARIRGIFTGTGGIVDAAMLERLPNLEIISCYSAGLDPIDVEAAEARGVIVRNNSPALADSVAELGMALLMAVARDVIGADAYVRAGKWLEKRYRQGHLLRGRKMGIVGLGHIGSSVARRAEAFGMEIGYHGRHRQPDKPQRYFASLAEMAEWAEVLMLTCPGGPETHHIVNAGILRALGPEGWVINLARGTVIDEAAMVELLEKGELGAAGLDVFENEPVVPEALLRSGRVVLSPHQGSATVEITPHRVKYFVDTLVEHFARGERAGGGSR